MESHNEFTHQISVKSGQQFVWKCKKIARLLRGQGMAGVQRMVIWNKSSMGKPMMRSSKNIALNSCGGLRASVWIVLYHSQASIVCKCTDISKELGADERTVGRTDNIIPISSSNSVSREHLGSNGIPWYKTWLIYVSQFSFNPSGIYTIIVKEKSLSFEIIRLNRLVKRISNTYCHEIKQNSNLRKPVIAEPSMSGW